MSRHDRLQTLVLLLVLVAVLGGVVHTSQKIGERNAVAAAEIDSFKQAVREEIVARFRAEQTLAQQQRDDIQADATEAKDLAKRALTKPATVVLTVRTPLPVIVTTTATPTPLALPSPTRTKPPPDTKRLKWFR